MVLTVHSCGAVNGKSNTLWLPAAEWDGHDYYRLTKRMQDSAPKFLRMNDFWRIRIYAGVYDRIATAPLRLKTRDGRRGSRVCYLFATAPEGLAFALSATRLIMPGGFPGTGSAFPKEMPCDGSQSSIKRAASARQRLRSIW